MRTGRSIIPGCQCKPHYSIAQPVPAADGGSYTLLPSVRTVSPAHLVWVEDDGQRGDGRESEKTSSRPEGEVVRDSGSLNLSNSGPLFSPGDGKGIEAGNGLDSISEELQAAELKRRQRAEKIAAARPTYFAFFLFRPGDPGRWFQRHGGRSVLRLSPRGLLPW